ncbi:MULTISPECIES: hypothetical protein [Pectobacterium]|uniref:hypothetical protein n=1 Tax=Pectobacterium TaxID=122277 RepID=UPI002A83CB13|nr:hypothetical protein [Pectobacterium aroidearum]MDY4386403.1 hypothetical protein [Pectobacterium aroidearum]
MNILTQYGKEIVSILVPLITFLLNNFLKSTAKMAIGELHQFSFLIEEPIRNENGDIIKPKQIIHTKSYVIINEGRETAKKFELIFNFKTDMHLNIWPARPYTEGYDQNGRYILTFDYVAPKENFRCEVLSINSDLPVLLSSRSEQGLTKFISLYPQKILNKYFVKFMQCCLFLGLAGFVYIMILLLQWLITMTG